MKGVNRWLWQRTARGPILDMVFREGLLKEALFKLTPEGWQRASNGKSQRVKVLGRGNNNCKDPEARKNSSILRSWKDASMAEVDRTRGPVGQGVVREGDRGHISRETVSQSKKLAFYSKHNPKPLQACHLGRDTVWYAFCKTIVLATVRRPDCSRVRQEAGWWRRGLCYHPWERRWWWWDRWRGMDGQYMLEIEKNLFVGWTWRVRKRKE